MTSRVVVALRVKASALRAFEVFTREINSWWQPNSFFAFTPRSPGVLALEAPGADGQGGRFTETLKNGTVFEIGKVKVWEPGQRLVLGWRQATFAPGQDTEVEVRFESVGDETRVTVEHRGWDTVPAEHVAKHHFPEAIFLRRHGEWWRDLLDALAEAAQTRASGGRGALMLRFGFVVGALLWVLGSGTALAAAPQDEFARWISGPWGRVDLNWKPYTGVLSRNSCPAAGVTRKEKIGLLGEGGTMWIEPGVAGTLSVYEGGMLPRSLSFVRFDPDGAAVYGEAGAGKRFTRVGQDALSEARAPLDPGIPAANYVRCLKKKT